MGELVDARGLACPAPVVKTREALKSGASHLEVLVDNATARDNVTRFATSQGCQVDVLEEGAFFRIHIRRESPVEERSLEASVAPECRPGTESGKVLVLSSDIMGRGDQELGSILIKAFLNTLSESETLPWRMVLFNRGVLLAVEGADTVTALSNLATLGVEILVCGTCLDYFGVKDKVAVGTVSNMYEILDTMFMASSSITL